VSYHQKKFCARCGLRCSEVEWRPLLEEYLCFECRSQVQLQNVKAAWRGRGKGDVRAEVREEGLCKPLPSSVSHQLEMFE